MYWELFWPGEILRTSPYSVRMRENADQNNSKYGYFLRSENQDQDLQQLRRSARKVWLPKYEFKGTEHCALKFIKL